MPGFQLGFGLGLAANTGGGAASPLQLNDKYAVLGDSYAAAMSGVGTNLAQLNGTGNDLGFANAFGGGVLTFNLSGQQGVGGQTITQFAARIAATNATGARLVFIASPGVNDALAGTATATSLSGLDALIAGLTAPYIVLLTAPSNAPVFTAPQKALIQALNTGIKARASNRVKIVDADSVLPDSSYFQVDNEHPNGKGAIAVGRLCRAVLASIQGSGIDVDAFIAANAIGTGANPTMSGGTTTATGWSISSAGGMTATGSKDASGDQVITLSGTYTGSGGNATVSINQFPGISLVAGDIIELMCAFKIKTDITNIGGFNIYNQVFSSDFGTIYASQNGWARVSSAELYPLLASDGMIYLRTPQLTVGAGAGGAFLQNNFTLIMKDGTSLTANGAVQIHRFGTRKVN